MMAIRRVIETPVQEVSIFDRLELWTA